jgi:sugar phosphate isomerase/epimerase|tara:strand:+ start:1639 stop:2487 length:849 start_codon:yes stop_codon:yes gene_type:complete
MICISTGLFKDIKTTSILKKLSKKGIKNYELSAGNFEKNIQKKILPFSKNNNLFVHNYFPRPKKDFILNLCSSNKIIKKRSFDHVIKGINLSSRLGTNVFSFHAGFLIDPKIHEIGKNFKYKKLRNKKTALKDFIKNVNKLAIYAKKKGVLLLIENNVITKKNLIKFKKNPLLMTDYKDVKKIMGQTLDNVYLLIDVAHLKVSSKTLGFCKIHFLKKCERWIKAYHLSENDGNFDTNDEVKRKSWFWKYLKKNVLYYSLEIKFRNINQIKKQITLTKNILLS